MGGQWRGVSTTSLSNTRAGEICARLGFSGDGKLNVNFFICHNFMSVLLLYRTHCDEL